MDDHVEQPDPAVDRVEPPTDFEGDELVVDAAARHLYVDALAQLPVPVTITEITSDPTLDLELLRLHGVAESAREIERQQPGAIERLRARLGDAYQDLDAVMSTLRQLVVARSGQWATDLVGKNRNLAGVVGYPQSRPMGSGTPEPAAASEYEVAKDPEAGRGVRVGVLDTGLYPHDELDGHYQASTADLLPVPPGTVAPWAGHATFVAGLVRAQAPAAEIVTRRVLDDRSGKASAWDTAVAMARFGNAGVEVLNLSLGCRPVDGEPPLVLRRAVEVLGRSLLIVAAAGNHGQQDHRTAPVYPAALPQVVAVGAAKDHDLDHADPPTLAEITPPVRWLTCLAPGFDVVSTYLAGGVTVGEETKQFHGYARWSGTSFAAASTSGAVAARTVPGRLTAKGALHHLLDNRNPVVRRYVGGA